MSITIPKDVWNQILQYCRQDLELPKFISIRDAGDKMNNEYHRCLIDTSRITAIETESINDIDEYIRIYLKNREDPFFVGREYNPKLFYKLIEIIKSHDLEEMS